MDPLTYSTDPATPLNKLRLQLWCAKEVLAEANRTKDNKMKGRAMAYINKDRMALRELAYKLRARLTAKKMYRVVLAGTVLEFVEWGYANSRGQAQDAAATKYGEHFSIVSVEEVRNATV